MNRPQFLAELNQYLTFFAPEERSALMAVYTRRFDDAGENGEGGVLVELGTPMRVAIDLKRRQEAGDSFEEIFAFVTGTEYAEAPAYNMETDTPETLSADQAAAAETGAQAGTEADSEESAALSADTAAGITAEDAERQDTEDAGCFAPEKAVARKKSIPGIIGATLLSIVLVAVFLCVAAAGALCITAAGYFIMAGLKTLLTLTDALFLFAGGLVLGGAGLLIVWFAIWAAISLITKLFRAPCGTNG